MATRSNKAAQELITFSKNKDNDGVSVWISVGRQNVFQLMKTKPKGFPKFNSNDVYMVL